MEVVERARRRPVFGCPSLAFKPTCGQEVLNRLPVPFPPVDAADEVEGFAVLASVGPMGDRRAPEQAHPVGRRSIVWRNCRNGQGCGVDGFRASLGGIDLLNRNGIELALVDVQERTPSIRARSRAASTCDLSSV